MKTILLFFFVFFCSCITFAQELYLDWVRQTLARTGSSSGTTGGIIALDEAKNVYIASNFQGTTDLDPGPGVVEVTLQGYGMSVVKLDAFGNFVWGKKIDGTGSIVCSNIAIDREGNVHLTGLFSHIADFDPGATVFNLTATPTLGTVNHDFFLLKLTTNGDFEWAKSAGNLNTDAGISVEVDELGNVYTTGSIIGVVDFDPGPGIVQLGENALATTFIVKHDKEGTLVWAKQFRGSFYLNQGLCIRTDHAGNIYISGKFEGTVDFDPGTEEFNVTVPLYSQSSYLCKLNKNGELIWVKENSGGGDFVVDAQQNVIVYTGRLYKYDKDGNLLWSNQMGGRPAHGYRGSTPVQVDENGNIFIAGEFNYTKDFDPGPGEYNMTVDGGGYEYDAFICKFGPDGSFVWAEQFGSFGEDRISSIALDASGSIYTSGFFYADVDFDPGPDVYKLNSSAGTLFILKLSKCANVTYNTLNVLACNIYTLNEKTYTASGTYTQTLINQSGCDSIITLHLTLSNQITNISAIACNNYTWAGNVYTESGTYYQTLISSVGCDSVVQLRLTINSIESATINVSICEGETFEGYTTSGRYIDIFKTSNGCDSTRTLNLTVYSKKTSFVSKAICFGQAYAGYKASGVYVDAFKDGNGCDSIRTLQLMVHPAYHFEVTKTICRGDAYMGYVTTGIYLDTFRTTSGCDSIQTTYLTVVDKPDPKLGRDTSMCMYDTLVLHSGKADSYLWQDGSKNEVYIVTKPGIYKVVASNKCGTATDEIVIKDNSCQIYFATAFTPNGDGKNDRFGMLNAHNVHFYHLQIYDRWGNMVFETTEPSKRWDGSFKGRNLSTGVFIWTCSFVQNESRKSIKGTVSLIR